MTGRPRWMFLHGFAIVCKNRPSASARFACARSEYQLCFLTKETPDFPGCLLRGSVNYLNLGNQC